MRKVAISQLRFMPFIRLTFLLLSLAILASNAFGQTFTTLYSFGGFNGDGVAPGSGVILDNVGNLFGTTGVGGVNGSNGTVFELSPPITVGNPWTETILHRFRGTPDGRVSESRLIMTAKGALLGTTLLGGSNDQGTAYMLAPPVGGGAWREKILHSFGTVPNDVFTPNYGLFATPEGYYGVDQGGANSFGAFYLLTPAGGGSYTQNILYSFKGASAGDGADPGGELMRDAAGNFYGVTGQGGVNNLGAVYEISPPAVQGNPWTEQVIYSFSGSTDGTLPSGRLLLGAGGVLYGTTDGGGPNGAGLVFELDPPTAPGSPWTEQILYAFTGGLDGGFPESGVIADKKGDLIGEASNVVFMLKPPQTPGAPWKEVVLHNFSGPDGFIASGLLAMRKNTLYGTTQQGGAFGTGTVFQITIP